MLQQHLLNKTANNISKMLHNEKVGDYMIVIGKVIGSVRLNDINRNVPYNTQVKITALEINKSRDLTKALRQGWIEIIEDRSDLKKAFGLNQVINNDKNNMNKEEILEIAKEMAKTMAIEMMKSSGPNVSELAKEVAKQINITVPVIVENNKTQNTNINQVKEENTTFIDVPKFEMETKNTGKVSESNENLNSTIEKMKRFKK